MSLDQLEARKSALLVIDLQNAFIHEKGTLGVSGLDTKRLATIVSPLQKLIKRCQDAGVPVIWTKQEHFATDHSRARKKLAGHTSKRKQVSALAGSWDEEFVDELKPLSEVNPEFVIRKHPSRTPSSSPESPTISVIRHSTVKETSLSSAKSPRPSVF